MARIHQTAIVDAGAQLADDVEVGPYCIVESDVKIGAGTRLAAHAIVRRYTTLGANNFIDSFTTLGGLPQDLKFDPSSVTYVRIGDENVFREGVTISRATGDGNVTTVGNNTYWMTHAHAGHNVTIADGVILGNDAAVGGYATIGRRAILSSNVGIHQFCWVGDMVMTRGNAGASTHVPPYVLFIGIDQLVGLNRVGLRRAKDITDEDRRQIREAFNLTYRNGLSLPSALRRMDECTDWGPAADKFRHFVRKVINAEGYFKRPMMRIRHGRRTMTE